MKNLKVFIIVLSLTITCGTAWAIPMSTVGGLDTFLTADNLGNSSNTTEIGFAEGYLSVDLTLGGKITGNVGYWELVDGFTDRYALALTGTPAYFLVKTGNNGNGYSPYTDFLFENVGSFSFAVIDLSDNGIKNLGKISHTNQFNSYNPAPVPEPSTLLLLGGGLLGLGWYGRKRKKA